MYICHPTCIYLAGNPARCAGMEPRFLSVRNQIKAEEEWYPKFQISRREKGKGHNGIRSIMGNADSPKQRINCSCSEAAELKLQNLNQKTLQNLKARIAFVQLHLVLKL